MTTVKPVIDDKSHAEAIARIDHLMGTKYGASVGDELEILSILVEAYEERTQPTKYPDLRSAVLFLLDQRKLAFSDLEALIGSKAVFSILEGEPDLSLAQARRLHLEWGVPAETLLA